MRHRIHPIVALVLAICAPVMATDYTFTDVTLDHKWSTAANWSPAGGPPTVGDHVLIPSGKLCIVDDGASADTIEVETGAELRLEHSLVLYGDFYNSAGGTSVIDGLVTIYEQQVFNIYGQLVFSNYHHAVQGSGAIEGKGGRLRIIGTTLWNQLATSGKGIRGTMRIQGQQVNGTDGILLNLGLVDAEGENTILELANTTTLQDSSGAVWRTGTCGTLLFKKQALNLAGDFVCGGTNAATFEFQATVRTCGTYTRNGGGLVITPGKTFDYASFATGANTCGGNPGMLPCESEGCACKYTVWSSVSSCAALCSQE